MKLGINGLMCVTCVLFSTNALAVDAATQGDPLAYMLVGCVDGHFARTPQIPPPPGTSDSEGSHDQIVASEAYLPLEYRNGRPRIDRLQYAREQCATVELSRLTDEYDAVVRRLEIAVTQCELGHCENIDPSFYGLRPPSLRGDLDPRPDPRLPSIRQRHERAMGRLAAIRRTEEMAALEVHQRACGIPPKPSMASMLAQVRQSVLEEANDPRGVQVTGCDEPELGDTTATECGNWYARCSYRTRNQFGALVLDDGLFEFDRPRATSSSSSRSTPPAAPSASHPPDPRR